jgi:hypothetical protein
VRRARLRLTAASALVCSGVVACEESRSHVYFARLFNESRSCIEGVRAVDIVTGETPPGVCPVCITGAGPLLEMDAGSGVKAFVGTMCPPLPIGFVVKGEDDPLCKRAIAAQKRSDFCSEDGGSSNPVKDGG